MKTLKEEVIELLMKRIGVVENEEYHDEAIKKIISFSKECGYELIGVEDSPIRGAKGNKEFLTLLKFS